MARRISAADVSTAAELKGVPSELALAVWQQESSSGKNTKTSPKGAVGEFQIMPATFRRYMPGGDINDPVDNMMVGLDVLADGLQKSGGDYKGAAQFYYHGKVLPLGVEGPNSGPGTPTTLAYSNQVAARAERNRQDKGVEPTQMPAAGQAVTTQPDLGSMYGTSDEEDSEMMPDAEDAGDDIPGLTRGLNMNASAPGMGGMGDMRMGMLGEQNYALDKYVRRIVDQEFKNA